MHGFRSIPVLLGVLPLLVLLGGCAVPDHGLPDNDRIARNFMRVAFGSEYAEHGDAQISKWTQPEIRVFLESQTLDPAKRRRVEADIADHLGNLERLTGLRFAFPGSASAENSHLLVFVLPEDDLRAELKETFGIDPQHITCFGTAFRSAGVIRGVLVGIPDELPLGEIRACLVEELSQSMGLFMDDRHVWPSVFNDDDAYRELTPQDELFLRALYDRRLRPGMERDEAEPLIQTIIDELRPPRT